MASDGDGDYLRRCFAALQEIANSLTPLQSPGSSASTSTLTTTPSQTLSSSSVGASGASGASLDPPRSRIWEEHRNVFRNPSRHIPSRHIRTPYSRQHQVWKHNFLCLASRFCDRVPGQGRKQELKAAGLGEKSLQIGVRANAAQLHEKIVFVYPKLRDSGGYELLRCLPNSRSLTQLRPPIGGHTPESLKDELGQARVYIRPLQKELDVTVSQDANQGQRTEATASGIFEKCLVCGGEIPIEALSQHLTSCTHTIGDDDDDFISQPPWRQPPVTSSISIVSSPGLVCINAIASPRATSTIVYSEPRTTAVTSLVPATACEQIISRPIPVPPPGLSSAPGPSTATTEPDVNDVSDDDFSPIRAKTLHEMFPNLELDCGALLLELFGSLCDIVDFLLDPSALTLLKRFRAIRLSSSVRRITVRPEHVVEDGLSTLFKGDFNADSQLEIELVGKTTADLGGVRRQFFTQLLQEVPQKLHLIEENGSIAFPTCNTDSLLSGHYARLGKLIVSSILQEGPGFPFFPKAVYYYLVGGIEKAVTHLSVDELPVATEYVVKKILSAESDRELEELGISDDYASVTTSSGIFSLLRMSTRDHVVQQIMVNEVICARKASLDQLFDGLCVLRFNELFQSFPEEFETLFVASENLEVSSNTLLELLQANCCSEEDTVTYGHLKTYINALDLKGCEMFLYFCTGSKTIPPIGFKNQCINVSFSSGFLPAIQACTCFHTLQIPHFTSYTLLHDWFDAVINSDEFNTL